MNKYQLTEQLPIAIMGRRCPSCREWMKRNSNEPHWVCLCCGWTDAHKAGDPA